MPRIAEVEGLGRLEFPDDTPDDVIESAVRRSVQERNAPLAQAAPAVAESAPGILGALQRGKAGALQDVERLGGPLASALGEGALGILPETKGDVLTDALMTAAAWPLQAARLPFKAVTRAAPAVGKVLAAAARTAAGAGAGAAGAAVDQRDPGRGALVAGGMTGAMETLPLLGRGVRWLRKVPGRYLSLPAERHAAGAEMLEQIPGRFGVSDVGVDEAYALARAGGPPSQSTVQPGAGGRALMAGPGGPKALPPVGGTTVLGPPRRFAGEAGTLERDLGEAAGPEIVLTTPERYGRFSQDVPSRAELANRRAAGATGPINRGIAGTAVPGAGGVRRQAVVDTRTGRVVAYIQEGAQGTQQTVERTLREASPAAAAPFASPPERMTASLTNFQSAVGRMAGQLKENPIEALRPSGTIDLLNEIATQAAAVERGGGATAAGVDRIIKSVNQRIAGTEGAERGLWKQILGSLHEDLRTAAQRTNNPAFGAFADAIHQARLNFLRQDLLDAIQLSGIRTQRTGQSVVTSPGAIQQWIRTHPEWVESVERAKPGLLEQIQQGIQEIIPITDIAGRSIPGQRYGSGRLVLGGAMGHLVSQALGLPPGTAESVGAILGGLSPTMGLRMSPAYIRRSFQPTTAPKVPAGLQAILDILGVNAATRPELYR